MEEDSYEAGDVRLVAEVLSPSTRDFDTFGKLDDYMAITTLDHILIIEPNAPQAILWSRGPDREWTHADFKGVDASIEIASLSITLSFRELYAGLSFRPSPRLVEGDDA